ncbi:MAG: hypothetical protein II685_00370, partial [Clostridia bacterium]|nr:hypothetical protein [Clostridia bacterium]
HQFHQRYNEGDDEKCYPNIIHYHTACKVTTFSANTANLIEYLFSSGLSFAHNSQKKDEHPFTWIPARDRKNSVEYLMISFNRYYSE